MILTQFIPRNESLIKEYEAMGYTLVEIISYYRDDLCCMAYDHVFRKIN